ncbi:hypothetical protein ABKN59_010463 [Abortiporus biennis]
MNIMIDILDVPEQELSQGTQRVDSWTMGSTSSSDDVVDSVPDSTYFSNVPTMLEWQWMGDMGGLYEVYETKYISFGVLVILVEIQLFH